MCKLHLNRSCMIYFTDLRCVISFPFLLSNFFFNFLTGLVSWPMIDFLLLVVKRVILWPNLGHLFLSAHAGTRYYCALVWLLVGCNFHEACHLHMTRRG